MSKLNMWTRSHVFILEIIVYMNFVSKSDAVSKSAENSTEPGPGQTAAYIEYSNEQIQEESDNEYSDDPYHPFGYGDDLLSNIQVKKISDPQFKASEPSAFHRNNAYDGFSHAPNIPEYDYYGDTNVAGNARVYNNYGYVANNGQNIPNNLYPEGLGNKNFRGLPFGSSPQSHSVNPEQGNYNPMASHDRQKIISYTNAGVLVEKAPGLTKLIPNNLFEEGKTGLYQNQPEENENYPDIRQMNKGISNPDRNSAANLKTISPDPLIEFEQKMALIEKKRKQHLRTIPRDNETFFKFDPKYEKSKKDIVQGTPFNVKIIKKDFAKLTGMDQDRKDPVANGGSFNNENFVSYNANSHMTYGANNNWPNSGFEQQQYPYGTDNNRQHQDPSQNQIPFQNLNSFIGEQNQNSYFQNLGTQNQYLTQQNQNRDLITHNSKFLSQPLHPMPQIHNQYPAPPYVDTKNQYLIPTNLKTQYQYPMPPDIKPVDQNPVLPNIEEQNQNPVVPSLEPQDPDPITPNIGDPNQNPISPNPGEQNLNLAPPNAEAQNQNPPQNADAQNQSPILQDPIAAGNLDPKPQNQTENPSPSPEATNDQTSNSPTNIRPNNDNVNHKNSVPEQNTRPTPSIDIDYDAIPGWFEQNIPSIATFKPMEKEEIEEDIKNVIIPTPEDVKNVTIPTAEDVKNATIPKPGVKNVTIQAPAIPAIVPAESPTHPMVSEVVQDARKAMVEHQMGYFMGYIYELFVIVSRNPPGESRTLLAALRFVINQLVESGQLSEMGHPAPIALQNGLTVLSGYVNERIKPQAEAGALMMKNRKLVFPDDIVVVLNLVDGGYTIEDGNLLLLTLDDVNEFYNGRQDAVEVAKKMVEGILRPYWKASPESKANLFALINNALLKRYRFDLRRFDKQNRLGDNTLNNEQYLNKAKIITKENNDSLVNQKVFAMVKHIDDVIKKIKSDEERLIDKYSYKEKKSQFRRIKDVKLGRKDISNDTLHHISKPTNHKKLNRDNKYEYNTNYELYKLFRTTENDLNNKRDEGKNTKKKEPRRSKDQTVNTKKSQKIYASATLIPRTDKNKLKKQIVTYQYTVKDRNSKHSSKILVKNKLKHKSNKTKINKHILKTKHKKYDRLKQIEYNNKNYLKNKRIRYEDVNNKEGDKEKQDTTHKTLKKKNEIEIADSVKKTKKSVNVNIENDDDSYDREMRKTKMESKEINFRKPQIKTRKGPRDKSAYFPTARSNINNIKHTIDNIVKNKSKHNNLRGITNNKLDDSSYNIDTEEQLKVMLSDAIIHNDFVLSNHRRTNDVVNNGENLFELSSYTDEESMFKNNIYKAFGYDTELKRN